MGSDFVDKSRVNPQALKDIRVLDPGEMMHYQSSITHRFNTTNEREHTMIYRDEVGELYLQTALLWTKLWPIRRHFLFFLTFTN